MPNENKALTVAPGQANIGTLIGANLTTGIAPSEIPRTDNVLVILARSGHSAKKYAVPIGSTIADLAKLADADTRNQDITIGPNKVNADYVITKPEMIFMCSKPKNA